MNQPLIVFVLGIILGIIGGCQFQKDITAEARAKDYQNSLYSIETYSVYLHGKEFPRQIDFNKDTLESALTILRYNLAICCVSVDSPDSKDYLRRIEKNKKDEISAGEF